MRCPSTHFAFEHRVFHLEGAYFQLAKDTGKPVYHVLLGDLRAVLPTPSLRKEFRIAHGTKDSELLNLVERGLRYVKVIRPFDSIPREILDGTASWSVKDSHIEIAKGRLTVQLASWFTGSEEVIVDLDQLIQLAEDPQTRKRVQAAIEKAANRLGIPPERKGEVTDRIDRLAADLAYIEALREHYAQVKNISTKLDQVMSLYRRDRSIVENVLRMRILIQQPIAWFDTSFQEVDAQTGEILSMLKRFEQQIEFIRQTRDEIHFRLMGWEEMMEAWREAPMERGDVMESRLRATYHFLASNFSLAREWPLVTKPFR